MKSIKEKQLLVKWAKAMNEPVDPVLVAEVERYEQIQLDIINSVRTNSIKDIVEASMVAEKFVEKINVDYPKPPTVEELLQILHDDQEEIVQAVEVINPPVTSIEVITKGKGEVEPSVQEENIEEETQSTQPKTLADLAAEFITKEAKLEERADSFQQPDPLQVERNLTDIVKKLKFLEQAIGKIAATGPGSGETKLLRLDDVDTTNLGDNKYLKYNATTKKLEFSTVSTSNVTFNLNGGTANQILVKKSNVDYDYAWEDLIVDTSPPAYTKLIDDTAGNVMYLGEAVPNSAEANAVWRIQKILFDSNGNVDEVRFANNATFSQVWSNRSALTYI